MCFLTFGYINIYTYVLLFLRRKHYISMIRIRKFPKTNCISLFFPKLGDFGSHDSSTVGIGPGTFPRAWLSAGRLSLASLGRCGFVLRKCCKGGELTRRDYFANPFIIYVIFIYLILYNIIHIYIYTYITATVGILLIITYQPFTLMNMG